MSTFIKFELRDLRKATMRAEALLKLLALVTLVLYAVGLFVTNIYLSKYGITDFSILKPQCLLTGLWSVIMVFLASIPGALSLQWAMSDQRLLSKLIRILGAFILFTAIANLLAGWLLEILGVNEKLITAPFLQGVWNPFAWGSKGWRELSVGVSLIYVLPVMFYVTEHPYNGAAIKARLPLLLFIVGYLLAFMVTGTSIYEEVNIGMGGGEPQPVLIQFSHEGQQVVNAFIAKSGTLPQGESQSMKDLPPLTIGELIHAGSERYVIAVCHSQDSKSVKIHLVLDKNLVLATMLDKKEEPSCGTQ